MFHLVRELLPFVVALYLLDTLTHLGPGQRLFLAPRLRGPYRVGREGFGWLGPFPDAWAFSSHGLLVALVPAGLFVPRKTAVTGATGFHPESFHYLTYAELTELEVEHKSVRLRPGRVVYPPSPTHAAALAERLRELRSLDSDGRAERLEEWRREADLVALRRRADVIGRLRRPVEHLSRVLCLVTFAGLPATLYLGESVRLLAALLLTLASGHVLMLVLAVRLLRSLRREAGVRIRGVLPPLVLSPPAAWRAPVALTRDVLTGFDDLTAAAAFLPRESFVAWARRELYGADHALGHEAGREWDGFWRERRGGLVGLLEAVGASEEEALAAPPRSDPEAESYCPLCSGEYRAGVEVCEDCGVRVIVTSASRCGPGGSGAP
jgi:hypothetical protein